MSSVFKKWISIALAIVLVLSYVPLGAAFAEVGEPECYGTHMLGGNKDSSHFVIRGIEMKSKEGEDIDLRAQELPIGKYEIKFDVVLDTSEKEIHFPSVAAYVNEELVVDDLQLHKYLMPGFKDKVMGTVGAFYEIKEGENRINLRASGRRRLAIGKNGWNNCEVDLTFSGVEYVTVTFEAYDENGEAFLKESSKVKKGDTVVAPDDPSLEGYEFTGWFDSNGAEFNSETPVSEDITYTAKFKQITHEVHFVLDGVHFDYEFGDTGSYINVAHCNTIQTHCENNGLQELYEALVTGPSKVSDGEYQYEFKGWKATKPLIAVAPQSTLRMPAQDQTEEEDEIISLDSYKVIEDVELIPVYTKKPAQTPEEPPTEEDLQTETAKFYFATIMDDTITDSDYVTNVDAFYPLNVESKKQLVGKIKGTKTDLEAIIHGEDHLTGTALVKYTYVYGNKDLSSASSKDEFLEAFESIKDDVITFTQEGKTVKLKLSDSQVGIRLMRVSRQKTLGGQGIDGDDVVHVDLRITRKKAENISVSYYLDDTPIDQFNNDEGILSEPELNYLKEKSEPGKFGSQYNIPIPALKAFKLEKVTKDGADLSKNDEGNYAVLFDSESHEIKVYFVSKLKYTVEFDLNGGKTPQGYQQIGSQDVYEGGKAEKPDTKPVREGYTFDGWFEKEGGQLKDNQFDFNTAIISNITLYAKWTPVGNGGGNPGDNPGGDNPGDNPGGDNPGDNPGGEENPGGGTPEDDTVEVEEEDTPLGTNEDENKDSNENKDPNKDETVEIDAEETPLGTSEEKTNEDATKETSEVETLLTLEEEGTPLGTAEPNPDSEQVVNLDLEEAVPLGTALPYTGQSSDVPVSVIGGLIVALGIVLKKISRR